MTSIAGKVTRTKSSMYGKLDASQSTKCLSSEDLLKKLYVNVGSLLNGLLQNYALGNFMEVKNELTMDKFNRLSVTFRNNSNPSYLYYEIVRLLFSKTLDGLMQSVNQYITLLDTTAKLEKCKVYNEILDDPDKLREHIEKLRNQKYLFNIQPISMIETVIKREYLEYIKLYGFPEGGIFKSDLLGDIIIRLENNLPMVALEDHYDVNYNDNLENQIEQNTEENQNNENINQTIDISNNNNNNIDEPQENITIEINDN
jgi:hypothetical protein